MCETIVVTCSSDVRSEFARLLAVGDFEGALGVAQVLWALCPNKWAFINHRSDLLGEVTAYAITDRGRHRDDVEMLGTSLLELRFDHSAELVDESSGLVAA